MFDFVTARRDARSRRAKVVTAIVSAGAHLVVLAVVVAVPLMYVSDTLPPAPDMLTFVVEAAPPPPPPPPPAAAARPPKAPSKAVEPKPTRQRPSAPRAAAPAVAPTEIVPEPDTMPVATGSGIDRGVEAMLGGVEGGVEGGLAGGIVGGIGRQAPPPPVPAPIRVGGQISPPELVRRVEPIYPAIAQVASGEGIVILEATVDERGRVRDVEVLRSHPLLANAAMDAVKQWQYEPLMLNGTAQPFVLTVTVSFRIG